MSQFRVTEFSTAPIEQEEVDLLGRLYHEIGLSAVAAALEILNMQATPAKAEPDAFEGRYFPDYQEEHLAA
ncbi:MAG TPA: hypothetical protein VED87_07825 [Methylocystis sp.]|nr:hypothetical protein [Methylocystis sp.]